MTKIVIPAKSAPAYRIAGEEFRDLWRDVTGETLDIITDAEALANSSDDLVVVGSDSVNAFTARCYLDLKVDGFNIRYETDDYAIRTVTLDGRRVLFLVGGRGRSTLYAVYRYFELYGGCRYFWDGDRIPSAKSLPLEGIDLVESPRHKYRGLRYFAHRSLHRFQAEHWSLEDWQREIDWMLKKRLNFFMLRIGLDDIFQKAFPDVVPYPPHEGKLPEATGGYDDRSLFWSLEYRGELRKKLLVYAFERDLMHPEDCGTMTHWYSRTPKAFLENVKPSLLPQANSNYAEDTGRVWDIFDEKNLENYFKLTDTHVREYGKPDLFHTIGFAERMYSNDREVNIRLKLYIYRRIQEYLQQNFPNAPLMLASWDMWLFYTPEEVRRLTAELDPRTTVILDYTSESKRGNNFENWGIMGRLPWVFGVFGAYEWENEMRGDYRYIDERLALAKSDPMCEGMIYWPELSHGDTFMSEYLAANTWSESVVGTDEMVKKYCSDRYGERSGELLPIWTAFMPICAMKTWSCDEDVAWLGDGKNGQMETHLFRSILWTSRFTGGSNPRGAVYIEIGEKNRAGALSVLDGILSVLAAGEPDEMLRRDLYDLSRAVVSRYVDHAIMLAEGLYYRAKNGEACRTELTNMLSTAIRLNELHCEILNGHEDFSMLETLEGLKRVAPVNPYFEHTLKENACNGYCRAMIYENAKYLYVPEMKFYFGEVLNSLDCEGEIDRKALDGEYCRVGREVYFATPLAEMVSEKLPLAGVIKEARELIAWL